MNETLWDLMIAEAAKPAEEQEYWELQQEIQHLEPHVDEDSPLGGLIGRVVSQTPDGVWNRLILEITLNSHEPRHQTVRGTFYMLRPIIVDEVTVKTNDFLIYIRRCIPTRRYGKRCGIIQNCVVLHPGARIVYSDDIQ